MIIILPAFGFWKYSLFVIFFFSKACLDFLFLLEFPLNSQSMACTSPQVSIKFEKHGLYIPRILQGCIHATYFWVQNTIIFTPFEYGKRLIYLKNKKTFLDLSYNFERSFVRIWTGSSRLTVAYVFSSIFHPVVFRCLLSLFLLDLHEAVADDLVIYLSVRLHSVYLSSELHLSLHMWDCAPTKYLPVYLRYDDLRDLKKGTSVN